jgi:hypothetical protein
MREIEYISACKKILRFNFIQPLGPKFVKSFNLEIWLFNISLISLLAAIEQLNLIAFNYVQTCTKACPSIISI